MENRDLLTKTKRFSWDGLFIYAGIIILAAFFRLLPHPPNVAPIAGLALFSGAMVKNKKLSFIIPLTAMLVSDFFLGFYNVMVFVYGSFMITVIIGILIQNRKSFGYLIGASLLSSVLFFLITNFGVWFVSGMYTHTFVGLMNTYAMGLPFFRNTIFGDLFYVLTIFYGYEYITILSKKILLSLKT